MAQNGRDDLDTDDEEIQTNLRALRKIVNENRLDAFTAYLRSLLKRIPSSLANDIEGSIMDFIFEAYRTPRETVAGALLSEIHPYNYVSRLDLELKADLVDALEIFKKRVRDNERTIRNHTDERLESFLSYLRNLLMEVPAEIVNSLEKGILDIMCNFSDRFHNRTNAAA